MPDSKEATVMRTQSRKIRPAFGAVAVLIALGLFVLHA
jgi:hypothetical protein